MSDKDQSQPPSSGHEQTRDSAKPQGERNAGAEGGGNRGRGGGGGGGRHGGRRRHGGQSSSPQNQPPRADASLNMEELRELMELFTSHGLTDFEIENEDIRVRLSKNPTPETTTRTATASASHAPTQPTASATSATEQPPANTAIDSNASNTAARAEEKEEKTEELYIITSPIVGTFYRSPSPTADVFVKQGSHVEPDTVVCIIEAMKLMNEIQAETTGVIEKVYVENGQPVEYGQPLFGIKK